MNRILHAVSFVLCINFVVTATIKLRYSVPRYHQYQHTIKAGDTLTVEGELLSPTKDTVVTITGSEHANNEFERESFLNLAYENAFEGFNATTAWDNATIENIANAPSVIDAVAWVDSMFEARNSEGSYAINVDILRDTANNVAAEGYIAFLFGGIRFPQAGTYAFITGGDDGGTPFEIDLDGDGTFEKKAGNIIKRDSLDATLVPSFLDSQWGKFRVLTGVTVEAGKFYRFRARYYNYSEISRSGLFWKKPDGTIETVGSAAFGERKQFGIPVCHIANVIKSGAEIDRASWSFLEVDAAPLTFAASTENMRGISGQFIWDFGDGSPLLTTSDSTASHVYSKDDAVLGYAPSVRVRRADRLSRKSPETVLIIPTVSVIMKAAVRKSAGVIRISNGRMELSSRPGEVIGINVFSISGQLVSKQEVAASGNSVSFETCGKLSAGTYLIRIVRDGREAGRGRFIVDR